MAWFGMFGERKRSTPIIDVSEINFIVRVESFGFCPVVDVQLYRMPIASWLRERLYQLIGMFRCLLRLQAKRVLIILQEKNTWRSHGDLSCRTGVSLGGIYLNDKNPRRVLFRHLQP